MAATPIHSVSRQSQGHRADFEAFHSRRAGDALRYAAAIVGLREAEDACQEAWLRIWRAWGQADPEHLDAWAFRVVRNCALDRGRTAARGGEPLGDLDPPARHEVEDVVLPRLEAEGALRMLAVLSLPLRETLWLREVAGLTYAEISAVQDVSPGTVMSRLHAARRRMAKQLSRERW